MGTHSCDKGDQKELWWPTDATSKYAETQAGVVEGGKIKSDTKMGPMQNHVHRQWKTDQQMNNQWVKINTPTFTERVN